MQCHADFPKAGVFITSSYNILIILLISVQCCCCNAACPNCGNMSVPYPLSTSSSCGDPKYKITCTPNDKQLVFETISGSYPITSINGELQKLVIRPPALNTGACITDDFKSEGLVLNQSLPFNVTSSNTIMLLNCSQILLKSPLNCSSNSLCSEFLEQMSGDQVCGGKLCCSFRAGGSTTTFNIQVYEDGCSAYTSVVSLDPSLNATRWNYGIELQWTIPTEPTCSDQSGCGQDSTCRAVNQSTNSTNQWRCLCNSGHHWDAIVGLCLKDDVCNGNMTSGDAACNGETGHNKMVVEASIAIGSAVFILVGGSGAIVVYCRRNINTRRLQQKLARERQEMLSGSSGGKAARLFNSKEMKRATQGFSKDRVLGFGGFGEVYKGVLDDGTVVAVKAAKVGNIKSTEQVLNEIRILSQVNHRSLVRLLGCCMETPQPLLVYEYISNGTLAEHLRGGAAAPRAFLKWETRLSIALQTAEGLAYLHSAAFPPIYHRDVKSSNILLDQHMHARVSDFGLSRLAEVDVTHISTCAQGTLGYLDPEYFRKYQLTDKSDVYSFGVVLLELATSKKAMDLTRGHDDVNLAVLVAERAEEGRLMELADRRLLRGGDRQVEASVEALLRLGLFCTHESRAHRPDMREVVEELRRISSQPLPY